MLRMNPLRKEDENILNLLQNTNEVDINEERAKEWVKCRDNPLYFILNYVYLPVIGVRQLKYTNELLHLKFRRVVRSIFRYHRCIMLASRQLGKSSIAACLMAWGILFFPNNPAVILNMRKDAAQGNLKKIRFIIEHLPAWMRVPTSSKSDIKTYFELQNGSRIDTFYPSTTHPPETLARSMSVPILYIDEAAFIPHIDEIYGSAQPTLSTAREQAELAGHPWFILMTSTPNGIEGDGKFFYDMYTNSIESDDLFVKSEDDGLEDWVENYESIMSQPSKNSFIRVKYHWSENPDKDLTWYEQQKKELNFDRRKINQELDLLFVGGSNCIFDDETLEKFVFINKINQIDLANQVKLDVYDTINPQDYYLIGVDTASSMKGAFNAIEVFSYRDFNQFAESNVRLGSLMKYGETVDSLFRWLYSLVGPRIILCIENNSIGKAVIEHLLYHVTDFNYMSYIWKDLKKRDIPGSNIDTSGYEYGINTNPRTKELMVSLVYDYIRERPDRLKSQDLIAQMSTIQRTNRGTISSTSYSDMFMSVSFCAYVRRMTYLEIMPLLNFSNDQIQLNFFNSVKSVAEMMNTKLLIKDKIDQTIYPNVTRQEDDKFNEEIQHSKDKILEDDWRVYMPMFGLNDY